MEFWIEELEAIKAAIGLYIRATACAEVHLNALISCVEDEEESEGAFVVEVDNLVRPLKLPTTSALVFVNTGFLAASSSLMVITS